MKNSVSVDKSEVPSFENRSITGMSFVFQDDNLKQVMLKSPQGNFAISYESYSSGLKLIAEKRTTMFSVTLSHNKGVFPPAQYWFREKNEAQMFASRMTVSEEVQSEVREHEMSEDIARQLLESQNLPGDQQVVERTPF
jgi:hypothetical protein